MKTRLLLDLQDQQSCIELESGKLWGLVGPNGVGKTTLLKKIAQLTPPSKPSKVSDQYSESYFIKTDTLTKNLSKLPPSELCSWVSYRGSRMDTEFPMIVQQFIDLGSAFNSQTENQSKELIKQFHLSSLAEKPLSKLSTGEMQRAYLAQGFNQNAHWMILDETLSHQDLDYQAKVAKALKELTLKGTGVVVVHHDLNWIRNHCESVLALLPDKKIIYGATSEVLDLETLSKLYPYAKIKESLQIQFSDG